MRADRSAHVCWLWRALVVVVVGLSVIGTAGQEDRQGATSSQSVEKPDYNRVFAMDRVHELRITIPAERFDEMQRDLARLGRGRGRGFGPGGLPAPPPFGMADAAALQEAVIACGGKTVDAECSVRGTGGRCATGPDDSLACRIFQGPPRGGFAGPAPAFGQPEPMAVRVSVRSSGRTWANVRMRYKGNSSLMGATATGNGKVPFRLEFGSDEPSNRTQSFFGFRKLTFSSNFADDSQLREVLATEVLRYWGIPAARAAFYGVFVDSGDGAKYWGLYTMVEDPADGAMLDAQLGGRRGNLYKPEGPGASWTRFEATSFEKKTNEDGADFSDVIAAIDALYSGMDDGAAWRARLERVFDVELFLRWLAVNTAIENWDTYGAMAHNYYLYGDPAQGGRLRWIPWDHNMSFGAGPGRGRGFPPGGRGGPAPFGRRSQDVLHRDVGSEWPLISRILSDPVYAARYRVHLRDALGGLMAPDAVAQRVHELHQLIAAAVIGPRGELKTHTTVSSEEAFRDSADALLKSVTLRRERIQTALAESEP